MVAPILFAVAACTIIPPAVSYLNDHTRKIPAITAAVFVTDVACDVVSFPASFVTGGTDAGLLLWFAASHNRGLLDTNRYRYVGGGHK